MGKELRLAHYFNSGRAGRTSLVMGIMFILSLLFVASFQIVAPTVSAFPSLCIATFMVFAVGYSTISSSVVSFGKIRLAEGMQNLLVNQGFTKAEIYRQLKLTIYWLEWAQLLSFIITTLLFYPGIVTILDIKIIVITVGSILLLRLLVLRWILLSILVEEKLIHISPLHVLIAISIVQYILEFIMVRQQILIVMILIMIAYLLYIISKLRLRYDIEANYVSENN